ncbi:MAG TPA: SGNH/GDSL hydrolase family protein [Polyangiaceae bacterium]|nr:SGNH/GDSL hydrolase family protein [Polyangiaceae bacterium]
MAPAPHEAMMFRHKLEFRARPLSWLALVVFVAVPAACSSPNQTENGSGGSPTLSGGAATTGGAKSSGGVPQTGGTNATGGIPSSQGGVSTTGGSSATGGSFATGGASTTGGSGGPGTGGAVGGTGGKAMGGASGGAATGGAPSGGTSGGAKGGSAGASGGQISATGGAASGGSGGTGQPGVRWLGRVDASNPAAVKFSWSGTGFLAKVSGTKVSVRLQTEGATSAAFFQPVVDGTTRPRFQVPTGAAQTVVLADNLSAGEHTIELYRETEGMYGNSIFSGFVDGTLLAPPPAPTRLIEIVGDSISAGYGNLGNEVHPPWDNTCTFSLDTESAYAAYGSVLARSLSAEVSIIAHSGWGMVRDLDGKTANVLSAEYENTLGSSATPRYDFARKPNAVIVNLGTNDSAPGDPGTAYEDAYVTFLRKVRSHYADAWIFLTIGTMTSDPMLTTMRTHITNVVTRMADAKIVSVNLDTQNSASTGCDYHPNAAEDQRMAASLKTAISSKLGW